MSRGWVPELRRAVFALSLGLAGFALFGAILSSVDASHLAFARALRPAPILLLYVAAFSTLGLLVARASRSWMLLPLAGVIAILPALGFELNSSAPSSASAIRVASYSVMGRNAAHNSIVATACSLRADVLALQEVRAEVATVVGEHCGYVHAKYERGLAVLSHWPLQALSIVGRQQRVVVQSPAGAFQLINVHLPRHFDHFNKYRAEMQSLQDFVWKYDGPLVIAGDFNSNQRISEFAMLLERLEEAHEEAGRGLAYTFPTRARRMGILGPFTRIDHILYSPHFRAVASQRWTEAGESDHYPVVAELQWRKATSRRLGDDA